MPTSFRPMKLQEVREPFSREGWSFELKLDGFRTVAFLNHGDVRLLSGNENEAQRQFPTIAASLEKLGLQQAIFDGELVCFNEKGLPDFHCMQSRFHTQRAATIEKLDRTMPADYCIFDLLYLDGYDLMRCTLQDRRALLDSLGIEGKGLRLLDTLPTDGKLLYEQAKNLGFEGIVGKRLGSIYVPGTRTSEWLKVKNLHTEEFIIGGFTEGEGVRKRYFGSLLLGQPEGDKIRYAGTSGGGFNGKQLEEITEMLRPLEQKQNPFVGAITARGVKHFVQPKLWAEVSFQARTSGGRIRIPVFQRLRPDLVGPEAKALTHGSNAVLDQLMSLGADGYLDVDGTQVHLSNLDRVMWPATGHSPVITKRDLIAYMSQVADWIIPHLRDRPLTFMRYGAGITGKREVERHWKPGLPEFVKCTDIWSEKSEKATEYILVNNVATLLWTAQIDALELHPWYSRVTSGEDLGKDWKTSEEALLDSALNYPDFIVFDLDPYIYSGEERAGEEPVFSRTALDAAAEVAVATRDLLAQLGLKSFLKWSGKTGFHLYVPIARTVPYEGTRAFAKHIGEEIAAAMPKQVTMEWAVERREGKVFFDYKQNVRGKTLVSVYSPRAVPGGRVAWPLRWEELSSFDPGSFTMSTAPALLREQGDLWAKITHEAVDLHKVIG